MVQSHFTENLAELVFCQIAVPKRLHQMNVFGWIVGMEHIQYGTKQIACIGNFQVAQISVCGNTQIAADQVLKAYKDFESLDRFLAVKIHLIIGSDTAY